MNTKTIIRIEHEIDSKGIWKARNANLEPICKQFKFYWDLVLKHDDFPTPLEDGLFITPDQFCAFKSVEQLQQWIEKDWWAEILELGFKVWALEVKAWEEGDHQIIYFKSDIVSKANITDLFK